ncbi:hypothetical protein EJV46_13770 [Roseococcus sp. SYP-B2431]|uniref:hypothetical protein n=1 Tax=Roseococcus sp. SYP-B2431 TaxID=2496640 RepID=UPI00103A507A|nr:hypothetical protein [Roseococcus sp. SYP-B2431]TCH98252.1 hypothetical protein EJV46_13770 [Roseococcus sp. SYP-B2431]
MGRSPLAMALFAALLMAPSARAETLSAPPPAAEPLRLTEGEARSRIEAIGYTQVTDLWADSHGLWHGRAARNGDPRAIRLDRDGNLLDPSEIAALTMFDRDPGEPPVMVVRASH